MPTQTAERQELYKMIDTLPDDSVAAMRDLCPRNMRKYISSALRLVLALAFLSCLAATAYALPAFIDWLMPEGSSGYIPGVTSGTGFLLWYFLRKDRKISPVAGMYPPEELTPADVAYIMNKEVRPADVLSLIIHWASKGYLRVSEIEEKGGFLERKGLLLCKLREIGEENKPYVSELFDRIFSRGSDGQVTTFTLAEGKFDEDLDKVCKEVVRYEASEARIFKSKPIKTLLVGSPTFVCIWYLVFVFFSRVNNAWISALVALVLSWVFVIMLMAFRLGLVFQREQGDDSVRALKLILMLIAVFSIIGASYQVSFFIERNFSAWLILEMIDISAPLGLMYSCRHRTKLGLEYMARLAGLKNFIESAGNGRIYGMANSNQQYFYDVLPYAMVLGVADKWTEKFERAALHPPEWYEGSGVGTFSPSSFVLELEKRLFGVAKSQRNAS